MDRFFGIPASPLCNHAAQAAPAQEQSRLAQAQAMMDAAKPAAPQAQSDNVSDLLNQLNF